MSAGGARGKSNTHVVINNSKILYWSAGPVTSKGYRSDGKLPATDQH